MGTLATTDDMLKPLSSVADGQHELDTHASSSPALAHPGLNVLPFEYLNGTGKVIGTSVVSVKTGESTQYVPARIVRGQLNSIVVTGTTFALFVQQTVPAVDATATGSFYVKLSDKPNVTDSVIITLTILGVENVITFPDTATPALDPTYDATVAWISASRVTCRIPREEFNKPRRIVFRAASGPEASVSVLLRCPGFPDTTVVVQRVPV
jgi:hypothetical protein